MLQIWAAKASASRWACLSIKYTGTCTYRSGGRSDRGNRGTAGLGHLERLAPCQTGDFPPDGTGFRHVAALSRLALKELQVISVSANPCLFLGYWDHPRSICVMRFFSAAVGNRPGSDDPGLKSWQGFGQVQFIGLAFLTNRFSHFSFSLPGLRSVVFQHLMTASSGCSLISSSQTGGLLRVSWYSPHWL